MKDVHQQQTLSESVEFSGTGLHSGNKVTASILPAPANSGIRFRRVDLEGNPEIEANIDNVSDTTRSTTLSKGNIKLHTVEHMLSTFSGMGVDNAVVELNANEPPIGDGSAHDFCAMVNKAGLPLQAKNREPLKITEPMGVQVGDSILSVFPHDGFKILRQWTEDKQDHYFIFTSNVDGQFQKAGFDDLKIAECHGSIHYIQSLDYQSAIYSADDIEIHVNEDTIQASLPLPTHPYLSGTLRPNILMFGDASWNSQRTDEQEQRYRTWKQTQEEDKLVPHR